MPKAFNFPMGHSLYSFLLPIINQKKIDECNILKTNQINGSWTAVFSKILYKKPLVIRTGYTASKNDLEAKKILSFFKHSMMERFAYFFSDIAVVTSETQLEYITQRYQLKSVIIVPNYVDVNFFEPVKKDKIKDIIFVGRLHKEKNLISLINAVAKTPHSLDIYGQGPLKNEIEAQIKKLGKEKQIKLCGIVPNCKLPTILNQYSIYVLPSHYEGLPKTLLEAMSCELCCIGTDVTGIREVIKHNKNGWLVKTDEESIKKSINLLINNTSLRKKLGKNARETIKKKFSLQKVIKKETQIYEGL